ncbi:hypothetical protein KY290_016867 [Solanum tuberosum]|uniref:Uncharacterized protein n=1 Tax=Solanum tuberosum TaxID=4113 RepID=A0ABQ7V9C8_SOLTU|nr:hypothetical protein KY289_018665 [Solanum tuberosum]KAH0691923.1 hypothetical protein KY289_019281 [Solanum tuberosum]KAH0760682.1 hypothetical protein KY290_016755 [Solanum tuberosum]KAH0760688.1 hypothetical protein KY290_016761 [Solanum tuberosum]KAH0760705.1 hypothetical protein KY290_016778 [Solanum tuberosum]
MGVSSFFAQLNLNRTLYEPKYRSNTLRAKAPFVPKRRSVRAEEAERSDRRGGAFGPKRRSVRAEEAERSRRRGGAFAPKRRSVRHGFFFEDAVSGALFEGAVFDALFEDAVFGALFEDAVFGARPSYGRLKFHKFKATFAL